jgi:hypothetical protein
LGIASLDAEAILIVQASGSNIIQRPVGMRKMKECGKETKKRLKLELKV